MDTPRQPIFSNQNPVEGLSISEASGKMDEQIVTDGGIHLPQYSQAAQELNSRREEEKASDEKTSTIELGEKLVDKFPTSFKKVMINGEVIIVSQPLDTVVNKEEGSSYKCMMAMLPNGQFKVLKNPGYSVDVNIAMNAIFDGKVAEGGKEQLLSQKLHDSIESRFVVATGENYKGILITPIKFKESDPDFKSLKAVIEKAKENHINETSLQISKELMNDLLA